MRAWLPIANKRNIVVAAFVAAALWLAAPPASANLLQDVASVSAGGFHNCALDEAGGIVCWGDNIVGQLGDGTTADRTTPIDVDGLDGGVLAVAAGGSHTCALTEAGGVLCWGSNLYGQLGAASAESCFVMQPCSTHPLGVAGLADVMAVAAGGSHTCALTGQGGVKCWGANFFGQLGNETTTNSSMPVDVAGLTSGVVAVAAGRQHTCALTAAGGVTCWGRNTFGQLGSETMELCFAGEACSSRPLAVAGLEDMVAVAAGGSHTCALTGQGGVTCWGNNTSGQLGDGTTTSSAAPVDAAGLASGVSAVAVGAGHSCALMTAGGLLCWGANDGGQLGRETATQCSGVDCSTEPGDVVGLGASAAAVTVGAAHSCARVGTAVQCWGGNDSGQLGDGSTEASLLPVNVGLGKGAVGDVDCDGAINSIDAALVLQRSAGLVTTLPCDDNADVNGDGRVDAVDAALILQYTAGLLTRLPP